MGTAHRRANKMDSLTTMLVLLSLATGLVWGVIGGIFLGREIERSIVNKRKKTDKEGDKP